MWAQEETEAACPNLSMGQPSRLRLRVQFLLIIVNVKDEALLVPRETLKLPCNGLNNA